MSVCPGEGMIDTWYDCTKALLANFFTVPNMRMLTYGPDPLPEELQSAELSTCINLARSSGSPGMDGITRQMVKAMWKALPDHGQLLQTRVFSRRVEGSACCCVTEVP